jgi:oxygen-independent coproporphyrinogen-3 oxidase
MAESLYIHIPFCLRKCGYCDFLSVPFDGSLSERYVEALIKEVGLQPRGRLKTVYIGGGTPTVLSAESIRRLFSALGEHFDMSGDAEITVEANPGTIGPEKVDALVDAGANRISIGVQSFNDDELRTLGRLHSAEEAEKAVAEITIDNVSLDLIYGIPGQGLESWRASLEKAVELGPKHISAYELTPEKCTPLMDALESGRLRLPDEGLVLDMYHHALDTLKASGYRHYEISNHASPGFECRHNLNYWRRGEYMALGAGAHFFLGNRRGRNTEDIQLYIEMLLGGESPVVESNELSANDGLKEMLFLGLRLTEGIDITGFNEAAGSDIEKAAHGLIADGLMESDGVGLRVTERGRELFNPVIVRLFETLNL